MLWNYNKISEDENAVIYAYGWNTEKTTGQLAYDKKSKQITVKKVADNDTQKGAEWAASHLPSKFINETFPEKTKVMIG